MKFKIARAVFALDRWLHRKNVPGEWWCNATDFMLLWFHNEPADKIRNAFNAGEKGVTGP